MRVPSRTGRRNDQPSLQKRGLIDEQAAIGIKDMGIRQQDALKNRGKRIQGLHPGLHLRAPYQQLRRQRRQESRRVLHAARSVHAHERDSFVAPGRTQEHHYLQ